MFKTTKMLRLFFSGTFPLSFPPLITTRPSPPCVTRPVVHTSLGLQAIPPVPTALVVHEAELWSLTLGPTHRDAEPWGPIRSDHSTALAVLDLSNQCLCQAHIPDTTHVNSADCRETARGGFGGQCIHGVSGYSCCPTTPAQQKRCRDERPHVIDTPPAFFTVTELGSGH